MVLKSARKKLINDGESPDVITDSTFSSQSSSISTSESSNMGSQVLTSENDFTVVRTYASFRSHSKRLLMSEEEEDKQKEVHLFAAELDDILKVETLNRTTLPPIKGEISTST